MYQRKHKSPCVRPCVVRNTKRLISIKTIEKGLQVFFVGYAESVVQTESGS